MQRQSTQRNATQRNTTPALILSAVFGLASVAPTQAQGLLEEVVVTAQKREESLTDVPVAVTLLSASQLENAFINNMENLQALVPAANFRKGNTTRNSALTMRGIGTVSFSIAAEPSVSTIIDGVVLGRSGQAFGDLYDLERAEILRGPQGTLFGKNASAGVVNIITKRPSDEFKLSLEASVYEEDEYLIKGTVSGPLGDDFRGSLTLMHKEFDGYLENVYNNQEANGYDRQGARGMLEYLGEDDLSVLLIGEYYEANDNCCTDLEALPSRRHPDSEAATRGVIMRDADGQEIGVELDLDQRRIDHDNVTVTHDKTRALSMHVTKGIGDYELTSITAWRSWDNIEFRDGDFTSIGGDKDELVTFPRAPDPLPAPFQLHDIGPQEWRQFSQELRVASPQGEQLEWQAGLFYWNIESERNFTRFASCQNNGRQSQHILNAVNAENQVELGNLTQAEADGHLNTITQANEDIDAFNKDEVKQRDLERISDIAENQRTMEDSQRLTALQAELRGYETSRMTAETALADNLGPNELTCYASDIVSATAYMATEFENYAVFGQGTFSVMDNLRVIFGARFTHDDVTFEHNRRSKDKHGRRGIGVARADQGSDFDGKTDNSDFSLKGGLQYDFLDSAMAYFTYSQGYKGPAFNVYYNMNANEQAPLSEETSDSYEFGLKYATGNLIANLAVFRTNIEGFQANNFTNVGTEDSPINITRLTNAGDVRTQGIEFDMIWNPFENFTLNGGFAYVDAEIRRFNCPVGATERQCTARSGLDVPFSPDLKIAINGEYVIPIPGWNTDFILNGAYIYTDEQKSNLPNNTGAFNLRDYLPDYHAVNLGFGFSYDEDKYRLTFIVKNLFDDEFTTTYSGDGFRYQIPREADRYVGVNVRANLY